MADFEIVPKQITVRLDRTLTVETLEGTAVRLLVPVYMQQRGCLKSPRQIAEGELGEPESRQQRCRGRRALQMVRQAGHQHAGQAKKDVLRWRLPEEVVIEAQGGTKRETVLTDISAFFC